MLDQLVADMNNQADWYVTGPDEGQCTAVPHEWEQRLGLPIVYGNAIDTYDNAPDDLYEKELNTPDGVPKPGAIIVYGEYAPYHISAAYGHTAVALHGCDANTLVVLEQNWGEQVVRIHSRDYGGVKGWFYPRILEPQPTPEAPPVPVPSPPPQDPAPVDPPADLPPEVPAETPIPITVTPVPEAQAPVPPVTPVLKPGNKTSEFKITGLTALLPILLPIINHFTGSAFTLDQASQALQLWGTYAVELLAIIAAGWAAVTYIQGRIDLKLRR